jgi:hypothetical protein
VTVTYSAELRQTQYRVERSITLLADETVGYVEESVENLASFDRPMQWVQHVTFGPPFLEPGKTFADAPVVKAGIRNAPARGSAQPRSASGGQRLAMRQSLTEVSFPQAKDAEGRELNLRVFSGGGSTWLLDHSRPKVYFTMYHSDYPVLIGYIFTGAMNRWILDWQENQRAEQTPWDGKVRARALCIGDSPIQGIRNAIERGNLFGATVYSWIQARQRRTQTYAFFLAEIPPGFKGVADVRTEDGRIVIVEQGTGRAIRIKSARSW